MCLSGNNFKLLDHHTFYVGALYSEMISLNKTFNFQMLSGKSAPSESWLITHFQRAEQILEGVPAVSEPLYILFLLSGAPLSCCPLLCSCPSFKASCAPGLTPLLLWAPTELISVGISHQVLILNHFPRLAFYVESLLSDTISSWGQGNKRVSGPSQLKAVFDYSQPLEKDEDGEGKNTNHEVIKLSWTLMIDHLLLLMESKIILTMQKW